MARLRIARLTTEHHIGTVFDSASGMRFPALVESTKTSLLRTMDNDASHRGWDTYPPRLVIRGRMWRLGLRKLKLQLFVWPSVDLK